MDNNRDKRAGTIAQWESSYLALMRPWVLSPEQKEQIEAKIINKQ